jgi:RHS repeat-associated protein
VDLVYTANAFYQDLVLYDQTAGGWCYYSSDLAGTWSTPSLMELAKNYGASTPRGCPACTLTNEPINAGTGNEFETETDFTGAAHTGLSLTRYYNSQDTTQSAFGTGWHGTWQRGLSISGSTVTVTRADGREDKFTCSGSACTADPDVTSRLVMVTDSGGSTGWQLTLADDSVETYGPNGDLLSITTRAGLVTTLAYDGSNNLTSVTGPFGHVMSFAYDTSNRVAAMTAPDGGVYRYGYDANNNLTAVTYPDATKKQYLYQDASFPHALTGIVDENNSRFVTIAYDSQGRATSSQLAGGADLTTVAYNPGGGTTVTDANGNAHTFGFTMQFGMVKAASLSGAPVPGVGGSAFSYDANGFMASRTDYDGNLTTLTHDARGEETSRTEASGTSLARTTATIWHPTFHLPVQVTDPAGRVTTFTYDAHGNKLSQTITAGQQSRAWQWTYNAQGQVLTATDPLGHVTGYSYDAHGNRTSVTDALGHATLFTAYDGAGRLLSMTDANRLMTTFAYDPRGRMLSRNVGGEVMAYAYDAAGNRLQVTNPDGSYVAYVYDTAHRLTHVADALNDQIAYALDGNGNPVDVRSFDPVGHATALRSFAYDSVNRMTQEIGAEGQTTTYTYDPQGNLTSASDPLGHATQYAYDALNRRVQATDALGGATRFGYDALDRLTTETDPRNLTTGYGFDGLDNQTSVASPDTGATAKTYDAAGNVLTSTDARGMITTYSYDALNRLTVARYADGTKSVYDYDQGKYGIGHLTRMVDPSGETDYAYDIHGRLILKTQHVGAQMLVTQRAYDKFGRLVAITYPSGRRVDVSYDADGRIGGLSTGRTWLAANVAYQPFGATAGWKQGNGASYVRSYDLDRRITQIGMGGTNVTYGYDAASRITGITEAGQPAQGFGYDALDRLTGFVEGTAANVTSYSYDADGNRLTLTAPSPAASVAYGIAATSNRLLSSARGSGLKTDTDAFTYDAAGNTLSDGEHQFAYDARGRMAAVVTSDNDNDKDANNKPSGKEVTNYALNGLGERVFKRTANDNDHGHETIAYVYDEAGHLLGEYGEGGRLIEEVVWLGDLPVATINGGGDQEDIHYISPDHLGSPHIVTDAHGRKVWEWSHEPFGNTEPIVMGGFRLDLRFAGQIHDAESGLNYNYFRDYNPVIGRYIQSDPIGLIADFNTYGYVRQSPAVYSDQYGLLSWAERQFVPTLVVKNAKKAINRLCGGTLSDEQIDQIIDEILENISISDAEAFASINPNSSPIVLNQLQNTILQDQINQLSDPKLRELVQKLYNQSQNNQTVILR